MKTRSFIKNFLSKPLKFTGCFKVAESFLGKSKFGYIMCWHDLAPEIFKSHVEALYPSKPIPLDELINRYKSGKSTKNSFAITFDDGVGSTVKNISKVCLQMNWPVTFYLPVGYLNGESLPYHKVEFLSKNLSEGEYQIPKISKNFYGKKFKKDELMKFLGSLIYTEHSEVIDSLLKYFLEKAVDSRSTLSFENWFPKPISWENVKTLSKNSIISFQSHSLTHTAVSSLNEDEIEKEMIKSKDIIYQYTGRKIHSFCYPYGGKKSIGDLAPKVAEKYFESATTLIKGRLNKSNPFYLPRIDLYEDDNGEVVRLKTLLG